MDGALAVVTALVILSAPPAHAAVPNAPTGVTVTSTDSALDVRWAAATVPAASPAVDRYTAIAYSAATGGDVVSSCSTLTGDVLTCIIPSLTNGTTYYVEVSAHNVDGTGAVSAPRVSGKPGGKPSAPRSVLANRTTDGLSLFWLAPATDGGSEITGYAAAVYTSTSPTADPVGSCSTTALTCSITGLSVGTTYYVSVRATNAAGTGPASALVTVQPGSAPSAPRTVKVTRGNGVAIVSWTPPASTGGSAITRYVARAFRAIDGGDAIASCEPARFTFTCAVGPLPNGTTYFIEVLAYTALAEGVPSSPRIPVVPATVPSTPRSVTADRIGPDVHVQWSVPESDGGLPIDTYVATAYSSATGGTSVGSCTTNGDRCDIHGLTGPPVYVSVIARTGVGDSPASTPRIKVRLVDVSDAVTAVAGSARTRAIAVTWQPPLNDGGPQVTSYTASAFTTPTGGTAVSSCVLQVTAANADIASSGSTARIGCTIGRLAQGTIYYLEVGSTTEVGTTLTDTRTAVRVRPGAPLPPRDVAGFPSARHIKVTWTLPASDGGLPITGYRVQAWSLEKEGTVLHSCTVAVTTVTSDYTCTLEVTYDFEPYWVEVAAQTTRGWGQSSKRIHLEANPAVPSVPTRVVLAPRDLGLTVRWTAPSHDGGYPVYSYVARAFDAPTAGSSVGQCTSQVPASPTSTATAPTTCTISGLKEDQYVYVEVTAENTVGISAPSARENATILPGRPVPPGGVSARLTKAGVLASWTAPASSATLPITSYRVRAYLTGGTTPVGECTSTTTSCTITAEEARGATSVTVAAQNSLGWSDPSAPVKVVSPQ